MFLLEIGFRTAVLYLFALVMIRLLGKRILGHLSPFELIVIIALGSSVGDPMMQPEVPLLHGMVVVVVLTVLHTLLGVLKSRLPQFDKAAETSSRCVVSNGVLRIEAVRREHLASDEIFMLLRLAGIRQMGDVQVAQLETSGGLSVYKFPRGESIPGLPLVPPPENYTQLEADALASFSTSHVCTICGQVQIDGHQLSVPCVNCQGTRFIAPAVAD